MSWFVSPGLFGVSWQKIKFPFQASYARLYFWPVKTKISRHTRRVIFLGQNCHILAIYLALNYFSLFVFSHWNKPDKISITVTAWYSHFLCKRGFVLILKSKENLKTRSVLLRDYTDLSQRTMLVALSSEGLPRHLLKLKLALILWWSDLDPFVQWLLNMLFYLVANC